MMDFLYRLYAEAVLEVLAWLRRIASVNGRLYMLLHAPTLQPFLVRTGTMRAHALFLKARRRCPAYGMFLEAEGYQSNTVWKLTDVPIMTKENYVKRYSLKSAVTTEPSHVPVSSSMNRPVRPDSPTTGSAVQASATTSSASCN
jgi:hypothetical protein